ncbi:unnamed protein product [Amoebophrya sp. A25]|nr:unnamed protein product [Amoebophrya sp. A25]|eukprot:GSA25T00018323001.1
MLPTLLQDVDASPGLRSRGLAKTGASIIGGSSTTSLSSPATNEIDTGVVESLYRNPKSFSASPLRNVARARSRPLLEGTHQNERHFDSATEGESSRMSTPAGGLGGEVGGFPHQHLKEKSSSHSPQRSTTHSAAAGGELDVFKLLNLNEVNAREQRRKRTTDTAFFNEAARLLPSELKSNRKGIRAAKIVPRNPRERLGARAILDRSKLLLKNGYAIERTPLSPDDEARAQVAETNLLANDRSERAKKMQEVAKARHEKYLQDLEHQNTPNIKGGPDHEQQDPDLLYDQYDLQSQKTKTPTTPSRTKQDSGNETFEFEKWLDNYYESKKKAALLAKTEGDEAFLDESGEEDDLHARKQEKDNVLKSSSRAQSRASSSRNKSRRSPKQRATSTSAVLGGSPPTTTGSRGVLSPTTTTATLQGPLGNNKSKIVSTASASTAAPTTSSYAPTSSIAPTASLRITEDDHDDDIPLRGSRSMMTSSMGTSTTTGGATSSSRRPQRPSSQAHDHDEDDLVCPPVEDDEDTSDVESYDSEVDLELLNQLLGGYETEDDGQCGFDQYSPEEKINFLQNSTDEELASHGIFKFRIATAGAKRATEMRPLETIQEQYDERETEGRKRILRTDGSHARSVLDTYMDESEDEDSDEEEKKKNKPKVTKFEARSSAEKQKTYIQQVHSRSEAGVANGPFQLPQDMGPLSRYGNIASPDDFLIMEDVSGVAKLWFQPAEPGGDQKPYRTPSTIVTKDSLFPSPQFSHRPGMLEAGSGDRGSGQGYHLAMEGGEEVILMEIPEPEKLNLAIPRSVRDPDRFPEEVDTSKSPRRQILGARMLQDRKQLENDLKASIIMRKGAVDAISKLFASDQKATRACGPFCYPKFSEYKPNHGQGLPVVEMMPVFEDRRNRFYQVKRQVRPPRVNLIRSAQQKMIDKVLLKQKKLADQGKGLKGKLGGKLQALIRKEGGVMAQIKESIRVKDHKNLHVKEPYHLLGSLKKHAESYKKFGLDWSYGMLNDLTSTPGLGDFLWDVDWLDSDQSARVFKATLGAENRRLAQNKDLLLNMFTQVPEGVIDEMTKKKREMMGKETNVENELLQADVEKVRQGMLKSQGVDPRKATESKIMENHMHHELELREMPLRHTDNYICAVRDMSMAYEIRDAYPPGNSLVTRNLGHDLTRLYCVMCNKIIIKLGMRTAYYYCKHCADEGSKPYCLCTTCNDQFRMSLMAYKLLEDTAEAEKDRTAAALMNAASLEEPEDEVTEFLRKSTEALFMK